MKYNRQDYMNKKCTHDEYYSQFVNDGVLNTVNMFIGSDKIKRSTDEHFNDIPLNKWDAMADSLRHCCGRAVSDSNDSTHNKPTKKGFVSVSLSDMVCVAKAAARQIRESSNA